MPKSLEANQENLVETSAHAGLEERIDAENNVGLNRPTTVHDIQIHRQEPWDKLDSIFTQGEKLAVIHGMPGTGKSTLAVGYAKDKFDVVRQLTNVGSEYGIYQSYLNMASGFGITMHVLPKTQEAWNILIHDINTKIKQLTDSGKKVALVIDNLQDATAYKEISHYIDNLRHNGANIIITTQAKNITEDSNRVSLKGFSNEEAKQYLMDAIESMSESEVDELLALTQESTKNLPQSLSAIAGFFKSKKGATLEDYKAIYLQAAADDNFKDLGIDPTHKVLLDDILQNYPKTWEALQYLSYLAPEGIPRDIFQELFGIQGFLEIQRTLQARSLITFGAQEDILSADQLFQKSIKQYVKYLREQGEHKVIEAESRLLEIIEKKLAILAEDDFRRVENWQEKIEKAEPYIPQAERLLSSIKAPLIRAKIHSELGEYYEEILIDYNKALEYRHKALGIREDALGEKHLDTASSYHNIGAVYNLQGKYEKALEYYYKALSIREEALGEKHPDIATSYNSIGTVYDSQGKYEKALEYYYKALGIREKALREKHPDLAISYSNIGNVYDSQGKYEKALEYYHKALSIEEEVLGEKHPHTATSYHNVGSVYYSQGNYEEALKCYHKALSIEEEVLGEKHPDTATSYNNIGHVYDSQGKYEKALEYYHKALSIDEEVLGEKHPSTAATYSNVGLVYDSQGKCEKALEYYHKALSIKEEVLGEKHPDTATSYNNVGMVYDSQGKSENALEYYHKALSIKEEVLGEKHPDIAISYDSIGHVYDSLGKYEKALEYYHKALSIEEEVLGEKHPDTATSYNNIGHVYDSQGKYEKALEYYHKALSIEEEVLGKKHPSTAISYNNIGIVYKSQGKYEKALEYYHKALSIKEEVLGEKHPSTATSYGNISIVFSKLGLYKEKREFSRRKEGISNEAIKPQFDPSILPVEIQLKTLLGRAYKLTEQGNWTFKHIFKVYLKGIYLQKKLGKLYSPDNLEAARMLILKYVCMATVHNNMEHIEVLLYLALEHKDLVIQTTKEHPDYFIEKGIVREFQGLCQNDEEYQTALSKVLEEDNSDEEEKVMDDSCHSALSHLRDSEDEDGDAGGSGGSISGHSTSQKAAQSSSSSSNKGGGSSSKGESTKTGETPPSKSALLAVVAEIESHGALIHDERLEVQLEHYAKTGVVYDTLAPYVEAAEAAHPILFRANTIQEEAREELQGNRVHITQELVDKIVGSIAERAGITYDEKLAAQAQHFLNTGNVYDTLHAYLHPQRVIEGMQQREAEEQVYEYEHNQTNSTTCTTCAQEVDTFIEMPDMHTHIEYAS